METVIGFHGDVLFVPVGNIPTGTKPKAIEQGGIVLAWGEVTGHKHIIHDLDGLTAFQDEHGTVYLDVTSPVHIEHEEHVRTEIPPGKYRIDFPQEYDHFDEAISRVAD